MKTDLKEVLNNTNLTPIRILEYYQEEVDALLKKFNTDYEIFMPSMEYYRGTPFYTQTFKEKQEENPLLYKELEDITERIGINIKEFLSLYDMLEVGYSSRIDELVDEIEDDHKYLKEVIDLYEYGLGALSDNASPICNCISNLVMYLKVLDEQEIKPEKEENLLEDKIAILEFYVNEFNRELDEKDAKISELEAERLQDKQDINALINEKIELKLARVLGD